MILIKRDENDKNTLFGKNNQESQKSICKRKVAFFTLNSHKKRKDGPKGSLDRVLFAAEFPKILVPRLPQHTSNVNIECTQKSVWLKQLYYLHVASFLEH